MTSDNRFSEILRIANSKAGTCVLAVLMTLVAGPAASESTAKIQPGQWRSTDTVLEMSNPLLSPEVVARRKASPAIVEYCVHSDDLRELLVGKDKAGACSGEVTFTNGRVSGTRTCVSGLGKGVRKFEGTYTAVKTDTIRETTQETPKGVASSKTHVVSERIGVCK